MAGPRARHRLCNRPHRPPQIDRSVSGRGAIHLSAVPASASPILLTPILTRPWKASSQHPHWRVSCFRPALRSVPVSKLIGVVSASSSFVGRLRCCTPGSPTTAFIVHHVSSGSLPFVLATNVVTPEGAAMRTTDTLSTIIIAIPPFAPLHLGNVMAPTRTFSKPSAANRRRLPDHLLRRGFARRRGWNHRPRQHASHRGALARVMLLRSASVSVPVPQR